MEKKIELDKDNYFLVITPAEEFESPDDWGNEDIFLVYEHRDFTIKRNGFKPSNIYNYLLLSSKENSKDLRNTDYDAYWIFPVYAYIHSGISLSLGTSSYPFTCEFDTSMNGFILVEKEQYMEGKFPIITTKIEAKKYAEGLINNWNQYLNNDVYAFTIIEKKECKHCKHIEEIQHDTMTGFYGEINDTLINDMLEHTEYNLKRNPTTENKS